jgi:hypothetical protein
VIIRVICGRFCFLRAFRGTQAEFNWRYSRRLANNALTLETSSLPNPPVDISVNLVNNRMCRDEKKILDALKSGEFLLSVHAAYRMSRHPGLWPDSKILLLPVWTGNLARRGRGSRRGNAHRHLRYRY